MSGGLKSQENVRGNYGHITYTMNQGQAYMYHQGFVKSRLVVCDKYFVHCRRYNKVYLNESLSVGIVFVKHAHN